MRNGLRYRVHNQEYDTHLENGASSGGRPGTDSVALDAVGLRILEAKRRLYFEEDSPMRPPAKHIAAAEEKHGVGIADPAKIDLVRLGRDDGVLI